MPVKLTTRGTPLRYPGKQRFGNQSALGKTWTRSEEFKKETGRRISQLWKDGGYDNAAMGAGRTGIRQDLGHFVRSSWEADICRFFRLNETVYVYEPKVFFTSLGQYRPDFYLPEEGMYVEVKGYDTEIAKKKRIETRLKYGVRIVVIGRKRFTRIIKELSAVDTHPYDFENINNNRELLHAPV